MSPLSRDDAARRRQLANLKRGSEAPTPPAPPAGNTRALQHGGHSEALLRDVSGEVRELLDALADAAPVRNPDGSLPAADAIAVERTARALKRYRHLSSWLDLHGRLDEDTGQVKPAAELELKAERELAAALDSLGMTPASRAKLGLDLARTAREGSLANFKGEVIDGQATEELGE
ncbi:MAG: P27 family phage terminase small subunit [Actinomycetota bacterium]